VQGEALGRPGFAVRSNPRDYTLVSGWYLKTTVGGPHTHHILAEDNIKVDKNFFDKITNIGTIEVTILRCSPTRRAIRSPTKAGLLHADVDAIDAVPEKAMKGDPRSHKTV
jgi:hypothetical protein